MSFTPKETLGMPLARRAALCTVLAVLGAGAAPAVGRADAPVNDAVTGAVVLDAARSSVSGTTAGATLAKTDPTTVCDEQLSATVWYALADVPPRDTVLRLSAPPGLTAVVAVYHVRNGRFGQLDCGETGDDGVTTIGVPAVAGDLVLVGQPTSSAPGGFTLQALEPQQPDRIPGRALRDVAHATVEEYLDTSDLWHVELHPGTTYRLSFLVANRDECPNARLYRPGTRLTAKREVLYLRCNAAASFTPGPDGGGRYLLLVDIGYASGLVPYRLQVARATRDETAPGVELAPGSWRDGRLDPQAVDQLDMYRFALEVRSDVTIRLGRPWPQSVSLLLLRESGKPLASGRAIRRRLAPGTYFAVVQAPAGAPSVDYRLLLRERGTSTLAATGLQDGHAPLGRPVELTAVVGRPVSRFATIELDRFDPLDGWLYDRTYRVRVGAGDALVYRWRPAAVGDYRFRITAPSRSGYVYVSVEARK